MTNRTLTDVQRTLTMLAFVLGSSVLVNPAKGVDFTWSSGDFNAGVTAPDPLIAADTLFIVDPDLKRFVGGSFTNEGLVRWQGAALTGGNSAAIQNDGTWQSESDDNTFTHGFGGIPTFTNNGTFQKTAGSTTNMGSYAFVNNGGTFDAQVGDIRFTGAFNTFNAGSEFTGNGHVRMAGSSVFSGPQLSDNLVLESGTHAGNSAELAGGAGLTTGAAAWEGGDLAGVWTIAANTVFTGNTGATKRQLGSNLTNNGTFRWSTTDELQGGNSALLTNNGLLESTESAQFNHSFGGRNSLVNAITGTVKATNSATLTLGNLAVISDGGLFESDPGSSIVFSGSANQFNHGTRFVGENQITGNATFVGEIEANNLRFVGGDRRGGMDADTDAQIVGTVHWEGDDLAGNWVIRSGSTVVSSTEATKRQIGGAITNDGTLRWSNNSTFQTGNGSSIVNNGLTEATESATFQHSFGGLSELVNSSSGTVRATNSATLTLGNLRVTGNGGLFEANPGSSIVYSGSNNLFNDGTRFVGDNQIAGNATFVGEIEADDLRFVGGDRRGGVDADTDAQIVGTVHWEGDDLAGNWVIRSGSSVVAATEGSRRQLGGNITNNGTFRWSSNSPLQTGNGSSFINNGLVDATESAAIQHNFGGLSEIANSGAGTIRATNSTTLTLGNLRVTGNGGLFEANLGSSIVFSGNNNQFNDGTQFVGDNQVAGNTIFDGHIQSDGLRIVGGISQGGHAAEGHAELAGTPTWEGGDFSGSFVIPSGSTLTATGGGSKRQRGSHIVNDGTIVWAADANLQGGNGSTLENNHRFEIQSDASLTHNFGGLPNFVNRGLIIKTDGDGESFISTVNLINEGTIDSRAGTIVFANNYNSTGILTGTSAFRAGNTLNNSGMIAPGVSLGTLEISSNFAQTPGGFLTIDIAGTQLGDGLADSHDQLNVTGNAALDGLLRVDVADGYTPDPADQFVVLTAGSVTGTFSNGAFGVVTLPGRTKFDVTYTGTEVILSNFGPTNFQCDLNGDNSIDAGDAGIMFANFGTSRGFAAGDCFPDGIIDAADAGIMFSEWTGDAHAVPEPYGMTFLTCLVLAANRLRTERR